jgi:hypothetical protein
MLSSFLQTLAQAEPLGPPSQRDMYPVIWIDMTKMRHVKNASKYSLVLEYLTLGYSNMLQDELESDDDKTDTMSVMSVATAVLDKRELEQQRHARPSIQYHIL